MKIYNTYLLSTVLLIVLCCGCADEPKPLLPEKMPLVVEAWIDEGEHPIVLITRAMNFSEPMDSLGKYVEKWCRVSIEDGSRRYYLTTRIDNDYIPSIIYTTNRLRGKRGVEYKLIIESESDTIEAVTKIMPSVKIDSVKVSQTENSDTLYKINVFADIENNSGLKYYKFFSCVRNCESRYYSSFLGTFEDIAYDPSVGYSVSKGIHNTFEDEQHFSPYYCLGDTVDIKLCTLSREQFDYWTAYENAVSLSGNLFFNVTHDCPSNLSGAVGYWFGYGKSEYRVIIR